MDNIENTNQINKLTNTPDNLKIEIIEESYNDSALAKIALDAILAIATSPEKVKTGDGKYSYTYYTSEFLKKELINASEIVNKDLSKKMEDGISVRFNLSTPTVLGNNCAKCKIVMRVTILKSKKTKEGKLIDIEIVSEYTRTTSYIFGDAINTRGYEKYTGSKILAEGMKDFGATMTYLSRYCLLQTMAVYEISEDVEQYESRHNEIRHREIMLKAKEAKVKNCFRIKTSPDNVSPENVSLDKVSE